MLTHTTPDFENAGGSPTIMPAAAQTSYRNFIFWEQTPKQVTMILILDGLDHPIKPG